MPGAAPVCKLASGVVDEEVAEAALTYEYEVWVTIETPPSGRVEVCVEVTNTDDNEGELVVDLSEAEALLDVAVESVVRSVVATPVIYLVKGSQTAIHCSSVVRMSAGKQASSIFLNWRKASTWTELARVSDINSRL